MTDRELIHHNAGAAEFDLPALWTVREMMRYESVSMLERAGLSTYERLWAGAQVVIQNWRGPFELRANLDEVTGAEAFDVVKTASMLTWGAYQEQQAMAAPKN